MAPKHERAKLEDFEPENILGGHDPSSSLDKFFNPNYAVEFMAKLPKRIRERAQVLLHYHDDYEKLRREFEEKETALRRKFDEVYLPIYERRKELVTGTGEPAKDEEIVKGFPEEHAGQVDITPTEEEKEAPKGVPGFWLRVLQHHVLSDSMIEEHDKELLNYLVDVRSGVIEGGYGSIAVAFSFDPNPYFSETTLVIQVVQQEKKTHIIRTAPTWNPGKDVTTKQITKKPQGKRNKPARAKTVTVQQPSFFSIFQEQDDNDNDDDDDEVEVMDDEQVEQLMQVLHTSVIPNAVNCYTGEAPDGSSDIESDDDDEEEEDEEEEDEEEQLPVVQRGRGGSRGSRGSRGGAPRGGRGGAPAPECKQQ